MHEAASPTSQPSLSKPHTNIRTSAPPVRPIPLRYDPPAPAVFDKVLFETRRPPQKPPDGSPCTASCLAWHLELRLLPAHAHCEGNGTKVALSNRDRRGPTMRACVSGLGKLRSPVPPNRLIQGTFSGLASRSYLTLRLRRAPAHSNTHGRA